MATGGLLTELDHSKLPNMKNLTPKVVNTSFDPGNKYSVCKDWGSTGYVYDTTVVKRDLKSWADFLDCAQKEASGSMSLLEDQGEVAFTYFWANGEAWFAWLMTLEGGDRIARVGQVPFLLVGAAAAHAMARRLGAGASSSAIAAAWFATITPLLVFGCEPNVDAQFVAGYLLAAYFFLRYALGDDGVVSLVLGALASGLT